jgi:hypothetical protein
MEYAYAFLAGCLATLTFHQGTLATLHAAGLWPKPSYLMTPTPPFGLPAVISLALWGGVWGVPLWLLIRAAPGPQYWLCAALFGAAFPSVVALFVVFPAKGMPLAGGWDPKVIFPVLLLNGAWGFGVGVFMRLALVSLG